MKITQLTPNTFPPLLTEITDPPEKLYVRGALPSSDVKFLAVVGSRKYSNYGRDACERLIGGLAGKPIVIVSGLALGIDSIAHRAALEAGLSTVAVPGSGLDWDALYPARHKGLAKEILEAGGALVSEFEPDLEAAPWTFPKRNRIMAGLSHATLVIEAAEKSGTLITARLAMEYNRDVLAVPGSIFSHGATGSNRLIKDGAALIRGGNDILEALGIKGNAEQSKIDHTKLSPGEKKIYKLLKHPLPKDDLLAKLDMPTHEANVILSAMELKGLIRETLGEICRIQ